MISKVEELLAIQEAHGSNRWHIHMEVIREDGVWLGSAAACCDVESFPVLRALRYGPTAEDAHEATLAMLRKAVAAAESHSNEEKELQ